MKKCTICKKTKSKEEFYKDKTRPDGLEHRCKSCKIQCSKKYKSDATKSVKICSKCKVTKKIDEFYKSAYSSDGIASYCKKCKKTVRKIWHRDTKKERNKQRNVYLKKNPQIAHKIRENRRIREYNAEGYHTLEEWENKKTQFKESCGYCKETKHLTKDHMTPLSRGGTNYINNIIPACKSCNSSKGDKTYEEFKQGYRL